MGYSDDIRTIAKTKEILDKADKALKYATPDKKESIETQRIKTNQSGRLNTGSNGSESSDGTDAGGSFISPPLAPPPIPNDDKNTNKEPSDSNDTSNNTNSSDPLNPHSTPSNDLSSSTRVYDPNDPTLGGSRSDAAIQADPYNKDPSWQTIEDEMISQGYSSDDIAAARQLYFEQRQGQHEIGDVATGDAGPKPTIGSWLSFAPSGNNANNDGLSTLVNSAVDRLNAIVGVDPIDPTVGIMVRFDNRSIIPSIAESVASGQSVWTDLTTPPPKPGWDKFELGYYWSVTSPAIADGANPQQAIENAIASIQATFPDPYPAGYGDADWDSESLTHVGNDYTFIWYQDGTGEVAPPNLATVTRSSCDGPHASVCPSAAEVEDVWPEAGLYVMSLTQSGWAYSLYDSEVPARYKGLTGSVSVKSAINGNTYSIEPAIEGGFMIYDQGSPSYLLYYGSDRTLRNIAPIDQYKFYKPAKAVLNNIPT